VRIALVGYFGAGRIADDLICYAMMEEIKDIRPDVHIDFYKAPFLNEIGTKYDLTLLGGGTLLGLINWNVQTPLAIYGTGYREQFPLNKLLTIKVARKFLGKAKWVVLRGKYSVDKCMRIYRLEDKLLGIGDPILLLNPKKSTDSSCVGSNVRKIPSMEPSVCPSAYYERIIPMMADYIAEKEEADIKYLSFCGVESIAPQGRELIVLKSPKDAIDKMNFKFWIGQRLHSSGLALLKGIPTMFLNYQFNKGRDFCSAIDYKYVFDFTGNLDDDYKRFVDTYMSLKEEWDGNKVQRDISHRRKELRKNLKIILEDIQ